MKLVITRRMERQLMDIGWNIDNLLHFLLKHNPANGLLKLCSPLKGITVYKAYLDRRRRAIFFINSNGLIYPVYVGDKNDLLAKNITVDKVRSYAEKWQNEVLEDVSNKKFKIRHY